MVSAKSLRNARSEFEHWKSQHPKAPLKQKLKVGFRYVKHGLEMNISKGTALSILAPTPDYIVKRINRRR